MAIDEVLLRTVASGRCPPTLRLYQWFHNSLILGRGQPVTDADVQNLNQANIKLLRRMTGGTAVLNSESVISYTVATQDSDPRFAGTVAESYRGVSLALIAGLNLLGLHAVEALPMDPEVAAKMRKVRSPVCFEIPSYYEITVDGRKLCGSSQMRSRGSILQHGTMYRDGDIGEISQYLSEHPDGHRIRSTTVTLYEALGTNLTFVEVAQALVAGFQTALNINLTAGSLVPEESSRVEKLQAEKYENAAWTGRL